MYNKIIMKKAHMKDLDIIYGIILECVGWLKSRGIKQWNPPYPLIRFKQDINEGKVYYFISRKNIIGTVTLSAKKPFYYTQNISESNISTWYLTKLGVPRELKNRGIGKKLLMQIEKKAKSQKIKRLKLDIIKSNKFLRDYYTKAGFKIVKHVTIKAAPSLLMEKNL